MDAIEALMTRRSQREYTDDPVSGDQVGILLRALCQAPSAADARPWHVVVSRDREILDRLSLLGGLEKLAQTPLVFLVCGDPSLEEYPGFWPQDCSCAAHNLQLAAHALGLGAIWYGLYPLEARVEPVRAAFGVPLPAIPFALMAVGYPAEAIPPEDRYDEDKIHEGRW